MHFFGKELMSTILFIQASPRGQRSRSIQIAEAYIESYRETHPDTELEVLNLFEDDLPPFDNTAAQGKYAIMNGTEASDEVKAAFANVVDVIEEFKACDIYVFAIPMWNFGIPYPLKHYLDCIVQPSHTFAVGEDGYTGLLSGKQAVCCYARGGEYNDDSIDFQKRYMDWILGFMGIKDIDSIVCQPTLAGGPDVGAEKLEAAVAKARELGRA